MHSLGVSCRLGSETHSPLGADPNYGFLSLQAAPSIWILYAWLGLQDKRTDSLSPSLLLTFMAKILPSVSVRLCARACV